MTSCRWLPWLGIIFLLLLRQGRCACYFPGELQGVWQTQVTSGGARGRPGERSPPTYQEITIRSDVIVQWGVCHARLDDNIILADRTETSECFRCVRLEVVSARVVQVWAGGMQSCYLTQAAAQRTCPHQDDIAARRLPHIMLYKSLSAWQEAVTEEVECPLNGRYNFTYRRAGDFGVATCARPTSTFSNCPRGSTFSVVYRDCTFPTPKYQDLQCLGAWVGQDNNHYLAVLDSSGRGDPKIPKYRCGMFREEAGNGRVFLALGEDSTCTSGLVSPSEGYETFVLTSVPSESLPRAVTRTSCTFPRTLLGYWHHTYVDEDTVRFRDFEKHMTYSARCVSDVGDGERFVVYSRTHCGDWNYNCLWLKQRSPNILELMLGLSPRQQLHESLCDWDNFGPMTTWITQAKTLKEEPTVCPILGNYVGELPDALGICAQLRSDCAAPHLMRYTVSDCRTMAVYEEREYECVGEWEEEGHVYALTFRRDINTYECFVGVRQQGGVVYIKEAGSNCSRGVQPEIFGMKITRKDPCPDKVTATQVSSERSYARTSSKNPYQFTTKPWKPITGRPRHRQRGSGSSWPRPVPAVLLLSLASAAAASPFTRLL